MEEKKNIQKGKTGKKGNGKNIQDVLYVLDRINPWDLYLSFFVNYKSEYIIKKINICEVYYNAICERFI